MLDKFFDFVERYVFPVAMTVVILGGMVMAWVPENMKGALEAALGF